MSRLFLFLLSLLYLLNTNSELLAYSNDKSLFDQASTSIEETRATRTLQWKALRPDIPGLYPYAHGDPINYIDLDGRFASAAWEGSKAFGQEFAQPKNLVSLGLDFTPYVGNAKSGYEAVAGEDPIIGDHLNYLERGISVFGVVPWFGNAVKGVAKAGKLAFKSAAKFGKTFKRARRGLNQNPFKNMSPKEIDSTFKNKNFKLVGDDPVSGRGSYLHPITGRQYYLDHGKRYRKGTELPHVDVHRFGDNKTYKEKITLKR